MDKITFSNNKEIEVFKVRNFEDMFFLFREKDIKINKLNEDDKEGLCLLVDYISSAVMSNAKPKDFEVASNYIETNKKKIKIILEDKELKIADKVFKASDYSDFEEFEECLLLNNINSRELKEKDKNNYELIKLKIDKSMLSNLKYLGYNIKEYKVYASTYLDKYIDRENTDTIKAIIYKELIPRRE